MALWWAKNLYTPFDLHLSRTYEKGAVFEANSEDVVVKRPKDEKLNNRGGSRIRRAISGRKRTQHPKGPPKLKEYAFHRQYVLDKSHLLKGASSERERRRILENEMAARGMSKENVEEVEVKDRESLSFLIPKHSKRSVTLELARLFTLEALKELIEIETLETAKDKSL